MTRPDYMGRGIANLMGSIVAGLGRPGESGALAACPDVAPQWLGAARHVVLLVVDGLGSAQLSRHVPGGILGATRVADLSSVFPSTTASAVTTFCTGDAPISHGLTGWHMWFEELGVVGAPLPFRVRGSDVSLGRFGTGAPELFGTRALSTRLARRSVLVHPAHLCGTPYTRAHSIGAQVRPFDDLRGLIDAIVALAHEKEPSFCYAYWPELDALSHVFGAGSENAAAHLRAIDEALSVCARRLAATGTVLLVSADHGFVDTRVETRLKLESYPRLARTLALPLCGEPRMVYCTVRSGAGKDFEALVAEDLGGAARMMRSDELLVDGWLGDGPVHPRVARRLGTHVLMMQGEYCLTDRLLSEKRSFNQVGVHGGMSDAELRVPLCLLTEG